jgi:hypothetical protein
MISDSKEPLNLLLSRSNMLKNRNTKSQYVPKIMIINDFILLFLGVVS